MMNEKVVSFPNSYGKVFEDIKIFLNSKKPLTRKVYERDIREFFWIKRQKNIERLTEEDLVFKYNDILAYQQLLVESDEFPYKNVTINKKIYGVRSLYNNLAKNDYNVNPKIFNVDDLPTTDSETWADLSFEEALQMADAVFETEKNKAYEKHCLILFATMTSYRIEAILKMKWSDLRKIEKGYAVKLVEKRDKVRETSISDKLYEKMLKMKDNEYKGYDSDIVFKLSKSDINRMVKNVVEHIELIKEDPIVFHSLRSVAMNWLLETTGDVIRAFEHSGHSSLDVFYNHYVKKGKDLTQTPGILMSEEMNWDFIHELTKEELIQFVINGGYKSYIDIKKMFNK